MTSRNKREGRYAGRKAGTHFRAVRKMLSLKAYGRMFKKVIRDLHKDFPMAKITVTARNLKHKIIMQYQGG